MLYKEGPSAGTLQGWLSDKDEKKVEVNVCACACACVCVCYAGKKIALTWVIYRFICVLVWELDLHYSCPQRRGTGDISWLTLAQVKLHYFNGHCQGRPLSPIVRTAEEEGEEEGWRSSFSPSEQISSPIVHREQVGPDMIIQLCLLMVNNAQCLNAHRRRIIGNRTPGDFWRARFPLFMLHATCHVALASPVFCQCNYYSWL